MFDRFRSVRVRGLSLRRALALSPLLLLSQAASAHVTLAWTAATAGTYYTATFQVGHGCEGSATRALVVEVPAGVTGVRPMPRAGWALAIDRADAARPGARGEAVRVTWTAQSPADQLQDAHYGEFVLRALLRALLPAHEGALHWPVRQLCEQGRMDWVEVPAAEPGARPSRYPAARIDLMPGAGGGHRH